MSNPASLAVDTTQRTCVIVMGPYRSGTSLVSQILSGLGVDFGPHEAFQLPADRFNPGGYFQRRDIVEANRKLIESVSPSLGEPVSPLQLLSDASTEPLAEVDTSWFRTRDRWGAKDPRFSITLFTWMRAGVLSGESVRIVRVCRDIDAIARSAVAHKEVGSFCNYDLQQAAVMTARYDDYARWHTRELGLPAFEVSYEALTRQPAQMVRELASFIGCADPKLVDQCIAKVGKRRALLRHYIRKILEPKLALDTVIKTTNHWLRR